MPRHIAIIGAGPVGLEAALAALEAGLDFSVYEASAHVAGNVRAWDHVQLFTPWSLNVSPRARSALSGVGPVPDGDECPLGREMVDLVFERVAGIPDIARRLRLETRVLEIGREGLLKNDEIGTGRRQARRFRLLVREPGGGEKVEHADVVLDCTGTYDNPNALGAGGIRAPGEAEADDFIIRRIPDFHAPTFAGDAPGWGGQRVLLVGAGHSAQTAARDLAELIERVPATEVTWAIRRDAPAFDRLGDDALPSRDALVRRARALALEPNTPLDVRLGVSVEAISPGTEGMTVTLRGTDGGTDGGTEEVVVDRIVSLTGSVGDARLYRQLQVHECWATSGPMKLAAALLASTSADCLDQAAHGAEALKNPEPDFYILGSKSYGRNTTFLLRVGWEQVDEVFSILGATPAVVGGDSLTP